MSESNAKANSRRSVSKRKTGYAWMLTINNPRYVPDIVTIRSIEEDPERYLIAYMVGGYENCSLIDIKYRKRTPHYQMLVVFAYEAKFSEVKQLFPRAHIEPCFSSVSKAVAYCTKQNTYFECGDRQWAVFLHDEFVLTRPLQMKEGGDKEGVGKYYQPPSLSPLPELDLEIERGGNES